MIAMEKICKRGKGVAAAIPLLAHAGNADETDFTRDSRADAGPQGDDDYFSILQMRVRPFLVQCREVHRALHLHWNSQLFLQQRADRHILPPGQVRGAEQHASVLIDQAREANPHAEQLPARNTFEHGLAYSENAGQDFFGRFKAIDIFFAIDQAVDSQIREGGANAVGLEIDRENALGIAVHFEHQRWASEARATTRCSRHFAQKLLVRQMIDDAGDCRRFQTGFARDLRSKSRLHHAHGMKDEPIIQLGNQVGVTDLR